MTTRSGYADLPLHGGRVPAWLATRMAALGRVIAEAIVHHYGADELLRRLSHPFWFQSFGSVMGMDWHSSGITTSVLGAVLPRTRRQGRASIPRAHQGLRRDSTRAQASGEPGAPRAYGEARRSATTRCACATVGVQRTRTDVRGAPRERARACACPRRTHRPQSLNVPAASCR